MPRSGVELIERIAERWRWFAFRVRFHPWTIHELPRVLGGLLEYARLMRLDRPIGIWLLLWPTLWALWTASAGHPRPALVLIFIAGTVLMRSAGCVINDLADRNIDPQVRRTRDRPLAARRVSPYEALMLFVVLLALSFVLVLQLDRDTVRLAIIGAAITVTYPLFK